MPAPAADYFSLLGLPRAFAVDTAALEAAYFAAQRETHPDRFVSADAAARAAAMQQAATVNDAYRTLKDPLARARYLLGATPEGEAKPDEALLISVLQQREALAEADDAATLSRLAEEAQADQKSCLHELETAFLVGNLPGALQLTLRLGYIYRQKDAVRVKLLSAQHF